MLDRHFATKRHQTTSQQVAHYVPALQLVCQGSEELLIAKLNKREKETKSDRLDAKITNYRYSIEQFGRVKAIIACASYQLILRQHNDKQNWLTSYTPKNLTDLCAYALGNQTYRINILNVNCKTGESTFAILNAFLGKDISKHNQSPTSLRNEVLRRGNFLFFANYLRSNFIKNRDEPPNDILNMVAQYTETQIILC